MRTALFLILSANCAFAQPKPPALLVGALRQLPGAHLLNRVVDLPDDSENKDAPLLPWIVADFDHDGRPDIVAAVVKRVGTRTQFGVIAVHAQTPTKLNWVVPLGDQLIYGVKAEGRSSSVVLPLFCIACDANAWFNWTGQSYELEGFGIGQRLSIDYSEPALPVALEIYALPKQTSRIVGRVKPCTAAKVLAVRGTTTETRWCFLDVFLSRPLRGWIPATSAVVEYPCPVQ